jgi:hypothetical protein
MKLTDLATAVTQFIIATAGVLTAIGLVVDPSIVQQLSDEATRWIMVAGGAAMTIAAALKGLWQMWKGES